MAEITVISPNVVELVGNLAAQPRVAAPPAPPRGNAPPKARDLAGDRSQNLAANNNQAPAASRLDVRDRPRQQPRPAPFRPQQPPNQPSSLFVTQLLAQKSSTATAASRRFDSAIAAYEKANASGPATAPSGIAFLTRTVDRDV